VKFGGSVLSDEYGVDKAASFVKHLKDKGDQVVVVVSALKGVTDDLLKTAKKVNPNASPNLLDELLAMGERTSARLFALALQKHDVKSVVIDPAMEEWPIITDEKHLDANPLLEECRRRVREYLLKMLDEDVVPVVCGFVGVSISGKITTLGRGGSDTTAVLLANCLEADETILVKDVGGVYSTDPKKAAKAGLLEVLTSDEVLLLSKGGAKVIHSKALMFLHPRGKIRIGSLDTIETSGTVILGGELPKLEVSVDATNTTMITIVGHAMNNVSKLSAALNALNVTGARILAASVEENSLILYLEGDGETVEKIHDYFVGQGLGKAVSHFPYLSMIKIYGVMLETVPGIVHRVLQPLAANAINVFGVLTISSSIRVFVSTKDLDRAFNLIKESLQQILHEKTMETHSSID